MAAAIVFVTIVAAAACDRSPSAEPLLVVVDTVGAVVVLREQQPIGWDTPRGLELDLMLGAGGLGEATFGQVWSVALMPDGDILVEDIMTSAVLRFSPDGHFVDSIGHRGRGPGEYQFAQGLVTLRDGTIAVYDPARRRVVLFDAAGAPLRGWGLGALGRVTQALEKVGDNLAVRIGFSHGVHIPGNSGWAIFDPFGRVLDTIGPFATPWDETRVWGAFHPDKHLAWHPNGFVVVGVSDAYHFELRRPDGTIRVEQPYDPVPVSSAERAAFDIEMRWRENRGGRFNERIQPPPEFKAAYSQIILTRTGDIWVFRHGVGEQWTTQDLGSGLVWPRFRERLQIDVFDSRGRLQGTIEADANIAPRLITNDTVWAVVTGENDEHYVARYLVR